ncbi:TPA: CHASE2 domain-containing protein [Legionella pneumophila]|uniref:CHASE2 domain-containing protein n=1 Tax=Legionella pneumophila TaxID=446 RepID=UPI00077080F2|nr:adenylate/guanylate cyclase domain-containing protein [Legionella pneumophila]MCZ4685730.1 adenylate/guanylate cyclase domain-containing protein [Legionella pneumophila]MDW8900131.1 adenylate/guanylate cyclase domain-containing protein [Legionella pneumophila]MDW8905477.1 adenylate/guanylate cyclase domain-containing protein [Legionella pneumophila]MDW9175415.1 adenylate/guanylate cyclase domain-containing protein [Legionella pneumophila]TIG87620.1 adenylate/guanylate cyclase domain-contain
MNKLTLYFPQFLNHIKWTEFFLGLAVTLLVLLTLFFNVPPLNSLISQFEGRVYDQIINFNWHSKPENLKVIIIDIDEKSLEQEGRWPWPRSKIAELLNKLQENGVVTVGFDIVMSEAETNYALGLIEKLSQFSGKMTTDQKQLIATLNSVANQVDNDQTLVNALGKNNAILGFFFHNSEGIRKGSLPTPLRDTDSNPLLASKLSVYQFTNFNGNLAAFTAAATSGGFVTNLPDKDGVVRHALLLANYKNNLYPSLSLAIAMNYLLTDKVNLKKYNNELTGIELDGLQIPTNRKGQILIPFWGGPGTLNYYSATDILNNQFNPEELAGSIALVGSSITLLSDLHHTPVSQLFPGVEIVGNIVKGLVEQKIPREFDWESLQGKFCLVIFGLLFALVFSSIGIFGKLLIFFITTIVILTNTVILFVFYNNYVPPAFLLTITTLQTFVNFSYSYVIEKRQKRRISELFGQYVPKEYVKELIEHPEHHTMEGLNREMTVLFTDIRNFTTISETLGAGGVKQLLNSFFTPMTKIIFEHRGTIDKYVGDMIVAFWGAPIEDKEHANHAVLCSLSCFEHLPQINTHLLEHGLPQVNIGVGIATGPMNVGDMGSEFRRAYTVLGDTVNLASRLESLTKFYQVNILVSDKTRSHLDSILWRTVDKVAVKGRKSPLTIYQPLGIVEQASARLLQEQEKYETALAHYYNQDWHVAEIIFNELKNVNPKIYLYQMYLERIAAFKKKRPSPHWDGVYVHRSK